VLCNPRGRRLRNDCGMALYAAAGVFVADPDRDPDPDPSRPQLYNYNCRRAHGPHVLACVPPTGHHTVGLVTACLPGYFIKHPRGKPACCALLQPRPRLSLQLLQQRPPSCAS